MPDVWVSKCRMVIAGVVPSGARGVKNGRYFVTGSSKASNPRSIILSAAAATMGLVTEASRKIVSSWTGTPASRSANPAARP